MDKKEIKVTNNPLSLRRVPNKSKTKELCSKAVQLNWRAVKYVPENILTNMLTLNFCLDMFSRAVKEMDESLKLNYDDRHCVENIVKKLPNKINNNKLIIQLQRQLGVRKIRQKYYDNDSNKFIVREYVCCKEEDIEKKFNKFADFYKYLDENIRNANLYEYNFKDIDLHKFNIDGALINCETLIKQNLYNDSFYSRTIKDYSEDFDLMVSAKNELIKAETFLREHDFENASNNYSRKIFYISDIHINHKLKKKFPKYATKEEVTVYIRSIVKKIVETTGDYWGGYLLIGGDISYSFEVSEIFYTEVQRYWHGEIVAILGNHELWDYDTIGINKNSLSNFNGIVDKYRDLFNRLNINFLQNELLTIKGNEIYDSRPTIISEEQLTNMNEEELKNICLSSRLTILGGLGFSGLNKEFNALSGIYRQTISSLHQDIEQTNKFNTIYKRLRDLVPNNSVIVFTHTPKSNWSDEEYNKDWIYVSGHTHKNDYCCDDEKTVYSDNQVGYLGTSIGLKFFKISKAYDIFKYYKDGIYQITREQYLEFNYGVGIRLQFNRTNGIVHMLKKEGMYCFIFENSNTGDIYLLNGGAINKLIYGKVSYYFERMSYYSNIIKESLSGYNNALKQLSNSVMAFGGSGTIHGCIVDIDFFNHIYVNPYDGKVTPYYALDMVSKYFYKNIDTLLLEKRKDLYTKYKKLLKSKNEGVLLLEGKKEINTYKDMAIYFPDTSMYGPSRRMKSLQYLTDINIIRVWNDEIIAKYSQKKLKN